MILAWRERKVSFSAARESWRFSILSERDLVSSGELLCSLTKFGCLKQRIPGSGL